MQTCGKGKSVVVDDVRVDTELTINQVEEGRKLSGHPGYQGSQ